MSARRRNLFILLLVAGLFAGSIAVIATKETKLGLDLRGGVELVYQAKPTPQQPVVTQDSLDRAIDVMRDRVDALGVSEPEIQRSGENQISVGLPDVENADEAQQQVGQVAQLYFYDWEPNVIGPDGKPDPTNPEVTGGGAAGQATNATLTKFEALQRAAKRPAVNDDNNTHDGQFWAVEEKDKEVLAGPADSQEDLDEDLDRMLEDGDIDATERKNAKTIEIKPGTVIIRAEQPDDIPDDQKSDQWYVLADNAVLRGTDVRNPEQSFDQGAGSTGAPNVTFEFSDRGKRIWRDVTRQIAQRGQSLQVPGQSADAARQHFSAVLDDEIISTPYIDFLENPSGIDASQGSQISGGFTIKSAQRLADQLKTGALPVRLELISQSQVSATLGQKSLDQGLLAGGVGLAIVALFLLVFYRVLGVIAVTALIVYSVYLFALVKLIPITLTLPGIAGMILTIGIAADANIVIFERVKEEIRAGRSVTAGLAAGYRKGIGAIIDANVVTIMVAFILFVLATAGVRGFAFTLGVGTLTSLFTAVLFTQAIVGTLGTSKALARPSALGAGGEPKPIRFDFMGYSKYFFSASGVILLICAIAIGGKGINLGIDFESGTRIRAALEKPADEEQIRDLVSQQGYTAEVQKVDEPELGENVFQISTENLRPPQVTQVTAALNEQFTIDGEPNTQSIGPTFGESVAKSAIIAVIASLLVISVYLALRFEWKYAVPVLIALAHDLLITAGIYALIGQEVTTGTVAALLTILGFSLYDTIIVFDRIRENVPRMPRATFSQVVNRSMSEVIIRSLATSFTAALPVFALMVFGGETLRDFAVALFVGTLSGTYSSVFIASQVLTAWKEREPVYERRRAIVAAENGGVIPPYATSGAGGQPIDVEPAKRRARRGLSSDAPSEVSQAEFDEMVRDLHSDKPKRGTAVEEPLPPAPQPEPEPEPGPDESADASPDDLYMKDDERKKRPRNRRHGRNR